MRQRLTLAGAMVAILGGLVGVGQAADWPQWMGPQRDGIWRETGLVASFPAEGPKVLWRQPVGIGYTGPAVADGKVYLMDRRRAVDADGNEVKPDREKGIPGDERIVCFDAKSGQQLWEHRYERAYKISYPFGPRTTPLVEGQHVWCLGAMGDLWCLDKDKGSVVWHKELAKEYGLKEQPSLDDLSVGSTPIWGYAAHPLIDGELLYCLVGGPGSVIVAFEKNTGKEVWRNLTAGEVGYSPPVIQTLAGRKQLIVWHTEAINGLDPITGKLFWTVPYPAEGKPQRPAVSIVTPVVVGDQVFITAFYNGPMLIEVKPGDPPTAEVVWRGKSTNPLRPDGLHSIMATPVIRNGHIYGVCGMGELRCLELATGKQLWQTYEATTGKKADCGTAFLVPIGEGNRFVLFNDQGELVLADLTPEGYHQVSRARILEPVQAARGRTVVWSHPAFANKCVFARNDKEIVCVSLAAQ